LRIALGEELPLLARSVTETTTRLSLSSRPGFLFSSFINLGSPVSGRRKEGLIEEHSLLTTHRIVRRPL
jgi:hypothetical protein